MASPASQDDNRLAREERAAWRKEQLDLMVEDQDPATPPERKTKIHERGRHLQSLIHNHHLTIYEEFQVQSAKQLRCAACRVPWDKPETPCPNCHAY